MGPDPQRKDAGLAREWIIAIVVVATLMLSCGTMLGYTTWYLSTDIEGVREAGMKANSDVLSRLALDEGRIGYLERSSDEHYTDEAAFRSKVAAQLDLMLAQLTSLGADLKVGLAGKENLRTR